MERCGGIAKSPDPTDPTKLSEVGLASASGQRHLVKGLERGDTHPRTPINVRIREFVATSGETQAILFGCNLDLETLTQLVGYHGEPKVNLFRNIRII